MPDKETMLQEAVDAGQSGDLPRARELLLKLLSIDNQEPLYWLLMSTAVESRKERIYCLHNVLKLDPDNSAARHDLKLLDAPLPDAEDAEGENGHLPAPPEPAPDWQTREIKAPTTPKKEAEREDSWSLSWIFGSLGLGIALIFFGYFVATSGLFNLGRATEPPAPTAVTVSTVTPDALLAEYPQMAEAHLEAGQPEQAIDLLEIYLRQEAEDASAWQLMGLSQWQAGHTEAALDSFARALELNSELPQAAYYTGVAYMAEGDSKAALNYLPVAVSAAPNWFEARAALAEALLYDGNPGSAFFELNAGASMAHTPEQWAAFYYWRATILDELGRPDTALPDWLSLMELPEDSMPPEWRQTAEQRLQVQ